MLTWILIVVGLLLSSSGAFMTFFDKHEDFNSGKIKSSQYKGLFLLSLCGAILTFFTNIDSKVRGDQNSQKAKELNDSLLHTQSKIIYLQDTIIKNLTGGGNVPKLIITQGTTFKGYVTVVLKLENNGNTPLRGLHATITDMYSALKQTKVNRDGVLESSIPIDLFQTYNDFQKRYLIEVEIGSLPPKGSSEFYYPQIPEVISNWQIGVRIQWDNGLIYCDFDGTKDSDKRLPVLKLISAGNELGSQSNQDFIVIFNQKD